jgi:hypothetical protein
LVLKSRLYIIFILILSGSLFFSYSGGSDGGDSASSIEMFTLPKFTDVVNEVGIKDTTVLGQSASWVDFNNDGFLDLIITNTDIISRRARNVLLFKNNGDGTFCDITEGSGIVNQAIRSTAWADFNNDGLLDLIVGTARGNAPPILYRNLGDNKFVDVTENGGVTKEGGVKQATWVDYDRDGLVDFLQAKPKTSYLYRNNGDETFTEVSEDPALGQSSETNSAVWFDSNNDGFQDLFLANRGSNKFYINRNGKFTDATESAGLAGDPGWRSVAACVGDYDNDGFFDLYVGNIGFSRNALYRNKGDDTFVDVTMETGTQDVGDARTCSWIDFDADGRIDVLTTNHLSPTRLFRNLGNGKLVDVAPQVGLDTPIDVFSATWGDYNADGFVDVFLNGHLGKALKKSGGNNANNLIIKLIGDGSLTNTSAIGTRVELHTLSRIQIREVSGGRGCCEQDMLPLHFGLGNEKEVDIFVKWTSGKRCSFNDVNVEGGKMLKLSEEGCRIEDIGV